MSPGLRFTQSHEMIKPRDWFWKVWLCVHSEMCWAAVHEIWLTAYRLHLPQLGYSKCRASKAVAMETVVFVLAVLLYCIVSHNGGISRRVSCGVWILGGGASMDKTYSRLMTFTSPVSGFNVVARRCIYSRVQKWLLVKMPLFCLNVILFFFSLQMII